MTDMPPTGDRPEPEAPNPESAAPEPATPEPPTAPEVPSAAPPASVEPSVPQWTSAEAAPAAPPTIPPPRPPHSESAAVAAAPAMAAAAAPPPPGAIAPPLGAAEPPAPAAWQPPPTAPPKTPEVPGAPGRYFAATVTRVAALLIDGILLGIVAGIIFAIVGAFVPGPNFDDPTRFSAATPAVVIGGIGGLIVSYLYFFLSWRSAGKATPGQRVFKMQVGNAFDGAALTTRQITIRWLTLFGLGIISVVPLVGGLGGLATIIWDIVLLVTTATSPTKQGMQDRWAGSAVVATGPQNTGLAWGCLIVYIVGIFVVILIAIFALLAVFAAFYNLQQ